MAKKNTDMGDWTKVEDSIFKFVDEGDEIEGTLVSIEEGKNFGNQVYKLEKDGKTYVVFGTSVLESQMAAVSIGDYAKIVFTGLKENKNKGQSPIKLFEVYFKRQKKE